MKRNDIILIASFVLVALIVFAATSASKDKGYDNAKVVVSINGDISTYPLSVDQTIELKNHIKLKIRNKRVCVLSSPCKNKICVNTGYISGANERIVCLPQGTFITIEKEQKNEEYDEMVK